MVRVGGEEGKWVDFEIGGERGVEAVGSREWSLDDEVQRGRGGEVRGVNLTGEKFEVELGGVVAVLRMLAGGFRKKMWIAGSIPRRKQRRSHGWSSFSCLL